MEQNYLDLLQHILDNGTDKTDRTGVGTRSIFGAQLRFNLQDGFPLLTTKKMFTKGIFAELAWLVRGGTNAFELAKQGVHIWDDWARPDGDLGPVYGKQWRNWVGEDGKAIDQLEQVLMQLEREPDSRRMIVTAWNPTDVPRQALPPCHMFYQFEVHDDKLSCHMYMRSADIFLGVPFNIASYAALTHLVARLSRLALGDLIISFGDVHIYNNHFDQVREQLSREPRPFPRLMIADGVKRLNQIRTEDFIINGYDPHPAIKAEVAV